MMRTLVLLLAATLLVPQGVPVTKPLFVDGLAQPVFADQTVVRHNVWVEVPNLDSDRDGVNDRMRVQISRPAGTDAGARLPIVLAVSPYSGGTRPYPQHDITGPLTVPAMANAQPRALIEPPRPASPHFGVDDPIRDIGPGGYQAYFLPRGFIFAHANSLGTGHSTGCPTIGGREENIAVKAIIDWFNGQGKAFDADGKPATASWTTGATAMIGTSFDGTLPIGAATLGVDGLKAIVPIAGVSSYYDHRRSYGLVINSFPMVGTDADTLFDNILSRKYPEVCAYMRDRIARDKDRESGDYNAFWDERNYVKDVSRRMRTAVFISHGLNDFNVKPRHAARLWAALNANGVPAKIWWNQGGHGDRANGAARQAVWRETLNRFWSHYLFGVENGAMTGAKATIEREDNTWVEYADWPVPGTGMVSLFPGAAAEANAIGQLSGVQRPGAAAAQELVVDDASVDATVLVAAPQSPHRLVYQSAPLTAPVHVSGIPDVSLRLAFDKPAANVSAMLVDYKAAGAPVIVTRGWADPQNRDSISRTTPVVPNTPYTIAFELQPHDYVFQAGSRVGFVVLSSDRLFTLRPPAGTRLGVTTALSSLRLPIVGGAKAWSAASAMTPAR